MQETFTPAWYPVGTSTAPESATAGPIKARQCFTRTPEGALYAVSTRIAEQIASAGLTGYQFSGYQWLSYTPDHVALVMRVSHPTSIET